LLFDERMTMTNRRRVRRNQVSLNVSWIVGTEAVALTASNAGEYGLFLVSERVLSPGSLMQLVLHLPTGPEKVVAVCRFVGKCTDGVGIGCEIFLAEEASRHAWAQYNRARGAAAKARPAWAELGATM
jgi:hypothetical protein